MPTVLSITKKLIVSKILLTKIKCMNSKTEKYNIVRFYASGKKSEVIRRDFTLEQAREWCSREDTREEGKWFDGYRAM